MVNHGGKDEVATQFVTYGNIMGKDCKYFVHILKVAIRLLTVEKVSAKSLFEGSKNVREVDVVNLRLPSSVFHSETPPQN